jgi:hypothetical protein
MKVIIGTPIHRKGAYVLEKFLFNQKQIQQNHADCDLVFCTEDGDYLDELKHMLKQWQLRGTVILNKVEKPGYAKSRLWGIASAREAIRQYFMSQPEADRLLFLDADMTYDPDVVSIMEKEMIGYDAVFSGYQLRKPNYIGLAGAGCLLLRRNALENIRFRFFEFRNGQIINEENTAEMDLFRQGNRIKKGLFLAINHYTPSGEVKHVTPHKIGLYRKIMNSAIIRFCLIRTSVAIHYNLMMPSANIGHFKGKLNCTMQKNGKSSQGVIN